MSIPTRASFWQLPAPAERKGFESLELKEGDVPKPGHKEVLVKVHATSLNYRDLIIAKGLYPLHLKEGELVPLSDGAGEVVALGPEVTEWSTGDRVTSIFNATHQKGAVPDQIEIQSGLGGGLDGMLAQYRVLPETALVRIPDHLSYEEAATLPCAAVTAWNGLYGLKELGFKAGETLVAQGTGGVSVFGLQFGLAAGGHVVITSSSDEKLETVRKLVPQEHQKRLHTHNYKKDKDWEKKVLEVTKGKGAAHVLEVGGPGTLEKAFQSIRPGGVVSDIGFVAAGEPPNVGLLALQQRAIYRGVLVGSRELFEDMNRAIEAHEIKPLVDKVFPFKEAREAYAYQWSGAHAGKVVVRIDH